MCTGIDGDRVSRVCDITQSARCHSFIPSGLLKRLYLMASGVSISNP